MNRSMIKFNSIRRFPASVLQHCKLCSRDIKKGSADDVEKNTEKKIVKQYDPKQVSKEEMEWRTPVHQRGQNEANQFLRIFYTERNNRNLLQRLQAPIDLSPSSIKKWWAEKTEQKDIFMQSYIPQRNQTLGNELAAAHFIVYRGGSIKFFNEDVWIKAKGKEYSLPKFYEEDKILEAIDCTDMNLTYEGLVNLDGLKQVRWLSLNGCEKVDDWFIDRISNIFGHSLIYLDLRNCSNITYRGIGALYKLRTLETLYLDDFLKSTTYEMTCLLLQEANPKLYIRSDPVTFEL